MGVFELVDIVTYLGESVVLSYSHRLKDWETALELYDKIKKANIHPSDMMAFHLLSTVGTSGKLDRLLKVFSQLQDLGVGPSVQNYNILIDSFAQALNWRKCLDILAWFQTSKLKPTLQSYRPLLSCMARVQLWDQYLEVYSQMISAGYGFCCSCLRKLIARKIG
jgi:pentatricopeptide repeat protein